MDHGCRKQESGLRSPHYLWPLATLNNKQGPRSAMNLVSQLVRAGKAIVRGGFACPGPPPGYVPELTYSDLTVILTYPQRISADVLVKQNICAKFAVAEGHREL